MASIPLEVSKQDVASIFLSYLGRAPEFEAMNHYVALYNELLQAEGDSPASHENAFKALSAQVHADASALGEAPSGAAVSSQWYVHLLYQNVLGRDADDSGLTYWSDQLDSGEIELGGLVAHLLAAAQGDERDAAYIANRTEVALEFAKWENSNPMLLDSLQFDAAQVLEGVNEAPESVQAALDKLYENAEPVGETHLLTPGIDTIEGTDADDVFNAHVLADTGVNITTLNEEDTIDGGEGNDTLNLTAKPGFNDELVGTVRNVETINITGSDNIGRTLTDWQKTIIQYVKDQLDEAKDEQAVAAGKLNAAQNSLQRATADAESIIEQFESLDPTDYVSSSIDAAQAAIQGVMANVNDDPYYATLIAAAQGAVNLIDTLNFEWVDDDRYWTGNYDVGGFPVFTEVNDDMGVPGAYIDLVQTLVARALEGEIGQYESVLTQAFQDRNDAIARQLEWENRLEYVESWHGRGTIDASFFEGATSISIDGNRTDVENILDELIRTSGDNLYSVLSYQAGATEGALNLDGSQGTVILDGQSLNSFSVTGTVSPGDAKTAGTLTLEQFAGTSVESLSVSISNNFRLNVSELDGLVELDLSGSTGNVGSMLNLLDLTGLDALKSYVGSEGEDYVSIDIDDDNDVEADFVRTIDLGAGNDHLWLDATAPASEDDVKLIITLGEGIDRVYVEEAFANISIGSGGELENTILITDFTPSQDVLDFSGLLQEWGRYVLTHDEADDVASAGDLYTALGLVDDLLDGSGPFNYTTFVFDGSTYIYADNGDSGTDSLAGDGLIELVGFTGELNAQNFVVDPTGIV